MAKHSSVIGGSSAERIIACPGSVNIAKTLPKQPASEYADEGSLLHKAMESIVEKYFKADASENVCEHVIGMEYVGENGTVHVITEELYERKVIPAFNIFQDLVHDGTLGESLHIEQQMGFKDKILKGCFGTADIIDSAQFSDGAKVCTILDWKFGDGVIVDVTENKQAMYYAAAAMDSHEHGQDADEFELIIVQPSTRLEDSISRWTTPRSRIESFKKLLVDTVPQIDEDEPRIQTGKHCKWCPAKPKCPQMRVLATQAATFNITKADAETLSKWLDTTDTLLEWIKGLKQYAYDLIENGQEIPNYKLVQKDGRAKIADETQAIEALLDLGLNKKDIVEQKLLGITKLRALIKKEKLDMEELNKLIIKPSSGLTLVTADDKRPAATGTAALNRLSEQLKIS